MDSCVISIRRFGFHRRGTTFFFVLTIQTSKDKKQEIKSIVAINLGVVSFFMVFSNFDFMFRSMHC